MTSRPRVPPSGDLTLGMWCVDKSEPGVTVWRMAADERFANPVGVVQGGFLAAFADSAMAASTVTWARHRDLRVHTANVEMKISFLRPAAIGGTLECTARVVGGRRVLFVEAEIVEGERRCVARASSTYLLTPREGGPGAGSGPTPPS